VPFGAQGVKGFVGLLQSQGVGTLLAECLRVTVGTPEENRRLLQALRVGLQLP